MYSRRQYQAQRIASSSFLGEKRITSNGALIVTKTRQIAKTTTPTTPKHSWPNLASYKWSFLASSQPTPTTTRPRSATTRIPPSSPTVSVEEFDIPPSGRHCLDEGWEIPSRAERGGGAKRGSSWWGGKGDGEGLEEEEVVRDVKDLSMCEPRAGVRGSGRHSRRCGGEYAGCGGDGGGSEDRPLGGRMNSFYKKNRS